MLNRYHADGNPASVSPSCYTTVCVLSVASFRIIPYVRLHLSSFSFILWCFFFLPLSLSSFYLALPPPPLWAIAYLPLISLLFFSRSFPLPLSLCLFVSLSQAHAKRVAAENKRSKRFALGGGFGSGRSRAARPKMGNARGKVMKAFAADSDDDESEEVRRA